jgi:hypothetical protein
VDNDGTKGVDLDNPQDQDQAVRIHRADHKDCSYAAVLVAAVVESLTSLVTHEPHLDLDFGSAVLGFVAFVVWATAPPPRSAFQPQHRYSWLFLVLLGALIIDSPSPELKEQPDFASDTFFSLLMADGAKYTDSSINIMCPAKRLSATPTQFLMTVNPPVAD